MKQLTTLVAFLSVLICFSQTNEIDSLSIELAYQKQDTSKVKTSIQLINALYQNKDYKKALLYIDQTEKLSQQIEFTKGIADANYYRALIYSKKNDYFNAIDHFTKARTAYQNLNDALGVAQVNNSIGIIEISHGNYEAGLKLSLSALQVFENRQLTNDLSTAYHNLAEAYGNTQQIDKALEFNFKALRVRELLKDSLGIKTSTKNIADLYSERREHRKAIEYYEKLLTMINPQLDEKLKGDILPKIGEQYLQFKEFEKASQFLEEGLKYNRDIENTNGILSALNALALLNLKQNRIKVAEYQLDEAYQLAQQSDDKLELLKNYKLHKDLDSTQGAFQSAFQWQSRYYNLKSELNNEVSRYPESTTVEDENLLTDLNNTPGNQQVGAKTPAQITNLRWYLYLLMAAVVVALLLFIFQLNKNKESLKLVDNYKHNNEQLRAQNENIVKQIADLEEINKVKDRLFSIVSHDLKDSISSIKGFIDLLREEGISQEEFYELVPELSENADNASLLLFNLLNWSKTQLQNLEPNPELFNVQDVFHTKMALIEQKAQQKRIVVIDESQKEFVYADKSMVEIVIQNLLTNAIKFSRTGDMITVSNKSQNGNSLICVEDTGVGIKKEDLDKLFKNNAFTTVGTKNEKGTGLGLSICKELVELNNGRIWVESTVNVGTKFYVELPKVKTGSEIIA